MKAFWLLVAGVVVLGAEPADERFWPKWRGPEDTGSSSQGNYATKWSGDSGLEWKLPLPGKGCSTPIVLGQQIILTAPSDGQDSVMSVNWKGQIEWLTSVGSHRDGKHRNGSGANPSPVSDGKGVFVYFKSGNLAGLDLEGNLLWKVNLQEEYGQDSLYWDFGTSPALTERYVVMAIMHTDEGYLAAFDRQTGSLAWKVDRTYPTPVEGDHSYTTPLVIEHGDHSALLVWGAERLTAHDPADGSILWSCAGFNPDNRNNWVTVATPVISGDVAVVPYGRGDKLAGIKLGGSGDVTKTHRLWEHDRLGAFVPTPAVANGLVYVLRDRGEVLAVAPKTGKIEWQDTFPRNRASYYASPVVAGSKLYATREDGVIFVAELNGGFKLLAENDLGERMIASPVPVADCLLLRGVSHLFCVKAN